MPAAEDLVIRLENSESAEERAAIRAINQAAFGGQEEADLVDKLRAGGDALLSLVATSQTRLVGHLLFSRMWIETADGLLAAVALAPVAVLPEHQRQGVGGRLIRKGLDMLRARSETIVIVVGHADYYPLFGFSAEKARPLASPFPADVFMAMELRPGALESVRGKVKYPAAFGL
jgi:putative acetyltransferase